MTVAAANPFHAPHVQGRHRPRSAPFVANARGMVEDIDATSAERGWATGMHLTALGAVLPFAFPVLVVGPLVLWLWKRDESPFLEDHGREALNFQLSLAIYGLASIALMPVLIGFLLIVFVYALGLVGMIKASVAANRGEYVRYPMTLRLVHGKADAPHPG